MSTGFRQPEANVREQMPMHLVKKKAQYLFIRQYYLVLTLFWLLCQA